MLLHNERSTAVAIRYFNIKTQKPHLAALFVLCGTTSCITMRCNAPRALQNFIIADDSGFPYVIGGLYYSEAAAIVPIARCKQYGYIECSLPPARSIVTHSTACGSRWVLTGVNTAIYEPNEKQIL